MSNDDMSPPAALRRGTFGKPPKYTPEELRRMLGTERPWAPFRDYKNREPAPPPPIYVTNPKLPVQVNVRQKVGHPVHLARYDNMAAFEAAHDRGTYPVVRSANTPELTLILCSAKPWAGKIATVPGINEPTPPTAAQAKGQRSPRASDEKLLAAVLVLLGNKQLTRGQLQAGLVADAWDKQQLDNSFGGKLNRMVATGALTKVKDGKVLYSVPVPVVAAPVKADAKPANKPVTVRDKAAAASAAARMSNKGKKK